VQVVLAGETQYVECFGAGEGDEVAGFGPVYLSFFISVMVIRGRRRQYFSRLDFYPPDESS
jgi:hypothetical protein